MQGEQPAKHEWYKVHGVPAFIEKTENWRSLETAKSKLSS